MKVGDEIRNWKELHMPKSDPANLLQKFVLIRSRRYVLFDWNDSFVMVLNSWWRIWLPGHCHRYRHWDCHEDRAHQPCHWGCHHSQRQSVAL